MNNKLQTNINPYNYLLSPHQVKSYKLNKSEIFLYNPDKTNNMTIFENEIFNINYQASYKTILLLIVIKSHENNNFSQIFTISNLNTDLFSKFYSEIGMKFSDISIPYYAIGKSDPFWQTNYKDPDQSQIRNLSSMIEKEISSELSSLFWQILNNRNERIHIKKFLIEVSSLLIKNVDPYKNFTNNFPPDSETINKALIKYFS